MVMSCTIISTALLATISKAATTKPNLVLVLADDLGYNDIGYMDSNIKSPELDAMAQDGVRLSSHYTWSWCAPSRGALLSGRYPQYTGYEEGADGPNNLKDVSVFPLRYTLLPGVLKQAGYRSVMAGKWHMGYATKAYLPESRGFDEYFGYLTGAEDYYSHLKAASEDCPGTRDLWRGNYGPVGNETYFNNEYSTKSYTDFLVQQINEHDTSKPLFIYASYQGVHGPLEVPKEYFELYTKSIVGSDSACDSSTWVTDQRYSGTVIEKVNNVNAAACCLKCSENANCDSWLIESSNREDEVMCHLMSGSGELKAKAGFTSGLSRSPSPSPSPSPLSDCVFTGNVVKEFKCDSHNIYSGLKPNSDCFCNRVLVMAQVTSLSEAVGAIKDALQKRAMWDNTVLVFTGDNGGPTFEAHSNMPLRGSKFNYFDGGIRPPAFITSPLLPAAVKGTWFDGIVHQTDWFATFARLAGVTVPVGVDGIDFWPTLQEPSKPQRTEVYLADDVFRRGQWKMITGADQRGWKAMLRDCALGTNGGHPPLPTTKHSACPADAYQEKTGLGCKGDSGVALAVDAAEDLWLCSQKCTMNSPCLFDLDNDIGERTDVADKHPDIVADMLKTLTELKKRIVKSPGEVVKDNGQFCARAKARAINGVDYVGPWVDMEDEVAV